MAGLTVHKIVFSVSFYFSRFGVTTMGDENLQVSVEAIDFQNEGLLFKELVVEIEKIRQSNNVTSALRKSELPDIIHRRTGITVKPQVSGTAQPNAYVIFPQVDRNNPVLIDFYREMTSNRDGLAAIKKGDGLMKGHIDRSKARVGGSFSELKIRLGLTAGLFNPHLNFSSEEIAAVILHELGHVFTYFEYLGSNITTNYVLQNVSRRLINTQETRRKYEIIKEGSEALGIKIEDPDALTRTNNETVIQTVVLREYASKRYSELDSDGYDMTAWEMLSDQFATRHGAGRHLVIALDKIHRTSGNRGRLTTGQYLRGELVKIAMVLLTGPLALIIIPLALIFVDTNNDIYDKPKARIERVKRDMVNALKDDTIDNDARDGLVADIEAIDLVLSEMEDRRTFLQLFWSTLRTSGRHNYAQTTFQQELEMLANNDVFVKASKLKSLSL